MDKQSTGFKSVDEYISTFPEDVQARLQELRATIKAAAPDSEERISYQMPYYHLKGRLVYFAAWKDHLGFYHASGTVVDAFKDELAKYKQSTGTIKFPNSEPLPVDLISRMVKFRVAENLAKAGEKVDKEK